LSIKLEIHNKILDSSESIKKSIENIPEIIRIIESITKSLKKGNKIILFGNGGSAADAQHIAAELVGRFGYDRKSLPAISLTTDTSVITSIGNDYSFEKIFSRQCESLVNKGDVVVGISTSGNSDNVINGVLKAKEKGSFVVGLTGNSGGKLKSSADILLDVPSDDTARIQEGHRVIIHSLCELIEKNL